MATSNSKNRSKWNAIYAHRRGDKNGQPPADAWLKDAVIDLLPLGANIVELGCGKGALSSFLAEHGYNVLAIDFSARALEYIKTNSHLKTLEMDLTEDFPDGQFDAVIAHHFYDKNLVPKMKNALVSSGRIIIKTFDQRIFQQKPQFNSDWVLHNNDFLCDGWETNWHQFDAPSSDSAIIANRNFS